jgi:hypothetical protein
MKKEIRFFNKLLKKMFGYKNYNEAKKELRNIELYFINSKGSFSDLKENDLTCTTDRVLYAKYKTLKKLLDSFLNCIEAVAFDYNEYKGELK